MASGFSGSSSSNWVMEDGDLPHVLAVDDNLIDRKIVEKLLRNSSCRGMHNALSLFLTCSILFPDYCGFTFFKWMGLG